MKPRKQLMSTEDAATLKEAFAAYEAEHPEARIDEDSILVPHNHYIDLLVKLRIHSDLLYESRVAQHEPEMGGLVVFPKVLSRLSLVEAQGTETAITR
jgi:hypothetical protein